MAKLSYTLPTLENLKYIADNLKEADRKEIIGQEGPGTIHDEILRSAMHSEFCLVCNFNDEPVAVFGLRRTSPFEKIGLVWLVTTAKTQERKVFVGRETKRVINRFRKDWKLLYNYVDEGNNNTIKWLKWLGAKVYPAEPHGIYGLPYHYFEFTQKDGE